MLGITECRIEHDLRAPGNAGDRQCRTFSRGVSAGREDHTIPAFGRCFSERPPEQLVTNPSGGRVNGNPVLQRVLGVFVELRGCVVRVQYVGKSAGVFREIQFRVRPQFPQRLLANAEFVRARDYRMTRAPLPFMAASTSLSEAMLVSPGVVMARAPWAAPYCTASFGVLPARNA
jgi:hypothetical protein